MTPETIPTLDTIRAMARDYHLRSGYDMANVVYPRVLFARIEHTPHSIAVQWAITDRSGAYGVTIHRTSATKPDDCAGRWREDGTELLGLWLGDMIAAHVEPEDIYQVLTVVGLCADGWVAPSWPSEIRWPGQRVTAVSSWADHRLSGARSLKVGDRVRVRPEDASEWAGREATVTAVERDGDNGRVTEVQLVGRWWTPADIQLIEAQR